MQLQIFDCLGQHPSQNVGSRSYSVVLEQVNQFTQSAVVAAVGGGLHVWRFQTAAQSTAHFVRGLNRFLRECEGAYQPFAADGAQPSCDGAHGRKTILTDW